MKQPIHIITAGDSFSYNTQYSIKDIGKMQDLLVDNGCKWFNFFEFDLLKNKYNPTFYYLGVPSFGNQLIIDSVLEKINELLNNQINVNDIHVYVQFTYFLRNLPSLPIKYIKTEEQKNDYSDNVDDNPEYDTIIIKNLEKIYELAKVLENKNIKFKFFFQENLFTNEEYKLNEIKDLIQKLKPYFLYNNEETLSGMGDNYLSKNSKNMLSTYVSTYDFHFNSIVDYYWYIDKILPLYPNIKTEYVNKEHLKNYKIQFEKKFLNQ